MKRLRTAVPALLALTVCLQFIACGGSSNSSGGGGGNTTPTLQSIQVTPANPNLTVGQTQQFTATGTYSDGSTKSLTSSANWLSSNTSVATISTSGLATAVAAGTSTITATSGTVSGTTTLTVPTATLVSIAVTPPTASVAPPNGTLQFTATGTYSDRTTKDLTATASWSTSNAAVATVTGGLATGLTPGTATITAALSGITGSATLTVTNPIVSIVVTPANPSIPVAITLQFTATAKFFDNTTADITSTATWTSSNPSVATVSDQIPTKGQARSIAPGTTTIQASSGGVNGSTTLTVTNATLVSIDIAPLNASLSLGNQLQYAATGHYSDSTTQNITSSVTWSSSAPLVANIVSSGLATGVGVGSTTIGAAKDGKSSSTNLTVNAASLVSIAITASYSTQAPGTSQFLTATGTFDNGNRVNITSQATWNSSDTTVATVGLHSGVARALLTGSTSITATLNGVTGALPLTVSGATIQAVTVTPVNQTIAPLTRISFTATGAFSDGSNQTITNDCTWASDNPSAATMAGATATGVAQGTANISATFSANGQMQTGSTVLNVSNATLTSIAITPVSSLLAPSTTVFFSAKGTFSDLTTQNVNNLVTWNSSDPNVASINSSGLATGQQGGTAIITATYNAITSNNANVLVEATALQSIAVTSPSCGCSSPTVPETISTSFTATGTFADGPQNLTSFVTWASSPPSVATISSTGVATGISPGTASITAVFAGVVGTASLNVTNATLTSITINPPNPTIGVGSNLQFFAALHFSDGSTVMNSPQVAWASSDTTKAVIATNGLATGVAAGTTTITATLNGVTGSTVLTVQ